MNKTTLSYMYEPTLVRLTAKVIRVIAHQDFFQYSALKNVQVANAQSVVLDRTCFYPQGGGQPWDTGIIRSNHLGEFAVEQVRYDNTDGIVHHVGKFISDHEFQIDQHVELEVNQERRKINTRNHSAGHLLSAVVRKLGLPLVEKKGYHFPEGPYVEFQGAVSKDEHQRLIKKIEEEAKRMIGQNGAVTCEFKTVTEMKQEGLHVPDNIPSNKPVRLVQFEDSYACPCGGTHIESLSEIGQFRVRKIVSKGNTVKISYNVSV